MNKPKKKKSAPMDPALKAVLVWILPSLAMRIVTALFGFYWLGIILQLLFYIFCGIMAGRGYHATVKKQYPKGRPTDSLRSGAKAGLTLSILLTILLVVINLIFLSLIPLFATIGLATSIVVVFVIPLDLLAGLLLGAFGGRYFFNY